MNLNAYQYTHNFNTSSQGNSGKALAMHGQETTNIPDTLLKNNYSSAMDTLKNKPTVKYIHAPTLCISAVKLGTRLHAIVWVQSNALHTNCIVLEIKLTLFVRD